MRRSRSGAADHPHAGGHAGGHAGPTDNDRSRAGADSNRPSGGCRDTRDPGTTGRNAAAGANRHPHGRVNGCLDSGDPAGDTAGDPAADTAGDPAADLDGNVDLGADGAADADRDTWGHGGPPTDSRCRRAANCSSDADAARDPDADTDAGPHGNADAHAVAAGVAPNRPANLG